MYPRSKLATTRDAPSISLSTVELNHGENEKFPEGPLEHRPLSFSLSANVYPEHSCAESCMLIPAPNLNLRPSVYVVGITLRFSTSPLDPRKRKGTQSVLFIME